MKNFLLTIRQFRVLVLTLSLICGITTVALAQAPTISKFSPNGGAALTEVTIDGTNFQNVTSVKFNNTPAQSFSVISTTRLKAIVDNGTTSGIISVTTSQGSVNTVTDFTIFIKWTGGNDNENWADSRNWSNGLVPTATTNVWIENGGQPVIKGGAICNNLTLISSTLTLDDNLSDLTVNGTFLSNASTFDHTAGQINFAATGGIQQIPALAYHNVIISGNGVKELQGSTSINNLTIVSSNLTTSNLNSHILTLNGTISGENNDHSFIGKLVKTVPITGIVTNNFGNIGIGFTNTNGGDWGAVTATRVTGEAIVSEYGTKSIKRHWVIAPTSTPVNPLVSLTLTWLDSELNGLAFTNGKAQAWRKELTDTKWTAVDNMQEIAINGSERSITVNTNTFSTWAITDLMNTLPVTLTSFNGKATEAGSQLTWATASEKNSDLFVIERSVNGKTFEAIGSVKAAGNTNIQQEYAFLDRNATAKTNYYRLRQVDLDGTFEYSAIITVASNEKAFALTAVAYPNPFNESLNLKLNSAVSKAEVVLKTIDGREVYRQAVNENEPVNNLTLNNLPKLKPGFYLLNLIVNNKTTVLKVAQQ